MLWRKIAVIYTLRLPDLHVATNASATPSQTNVPVLSQYCWQHHNNIMSLYCCHLIHSQAILLEESMIPWRQKHHTTRTMEVSLLLDVSWRSVTFSHQELHKQLLCNEITCYVAILIERLLCTILKCSSSSDAQNKYRKCGYSIWGKPASKQTFLVRGKCISAFACISSAGLIM